MIRSLPRFTALVLTLIAAAPATVAAQDTAPPPKNPSGSPAQTDADAGKAAASSGNLGDRTRLNLLDAEISVKEELA